MIQLYVLMKPLRKSLLLADAINLKDSDNKMKTQCDKDICY